MENSVTFTSTFAPGPILSTLIDFLPFASLRALQLTCRRYSDLYAYALPTKWNIDEHLSRWFKDPRALRQALDENEALISGSAALQFFGSPTMWQPGDVDVYCPSPSAEILHQHLLKIQDCVFVQTKTGEDTLYPIFELREVRYYTCLSAVTREAEKVQLIVTGPDVEIDPFTTGYFLSPSNWDPLKAIIHDFHSTVVMNLIFGSQAISLFPNPCFIWYKNYLCKNIDRSKRRGLEKYVKRGWALAEVRPRDRAKASNPMRNLRFIGDKYCWRIHYGPQGVSRMLPDVDEINGINPAYGLHWTCTEIEERMYRQIRDDPQDRLSMTRVHIYSMYTSREENGAWQKRRDRFQALSKLSGKARIL